MRWVSSFPGFGLRLTRWGGVYLVAMVLLALAAANTGNNALVMLLGLAMGSFVLSGTWSRQVLGKVEVSVAVPRQAYAASFVTAEVELVNRSRLFPAYGLVVRDQEGGALLFVPLLRAGERQCHVARTLFPHRGWQTVGPWRLEVLLPLGFFLKSKRVGAAHRVLVYPRLLPSLASLLRPGGDRRRPGSTGERGREGEVHQLRGFRDGDERRQIHWKQSARQQRLISIERETRQAEPLYVVVDPRCRNPDDPQVREAFETLVSRAATVVVDRLQRGLPVGVVVGRRIVEPQARLDRVGVLLQPLAEVQLCASDAPPPPSLRRWVLELKVGRQAA